ncbi:uncharacterized protein BDW47DRAFT_119397 [Aspergillus candidus]|uniref:C6 zinc finger domain protein n=1 Tax=Aspergillus candidus TaxID=41067 RepID=A0A2I2F4T9_ASPCN|nr:C6 zinc finger domain protein [Aspergillus candidus]PLB35598.1 C6 zinc finger domain protein [Aspergillus candidus]
MPRLGPACLTCREKCRKCDRARPTCQRCISKGLVCGGYPEQFRFCGIASRGKWRDARAPVRNRGQECIELPSPEATPDEDPRSPHADGSQSVEERRSQSGPVDEITALLNAPQSERLLSHYDSFICPHQIAEIGSSSDNPYRAYILPLAQKQIGLLYAVLGLSASHLGQLTKDPQLHQDTAVEYRMRAIRALGEEIRKSQEETLSEDEQDAVFAIIQILLLHDICESGISSHGIHITGAMSVCKRLLIAEGLNGQRKRAVFFLGNLAWLDVIRAFSGPERLCFPQEIREMVACASSLNFEMVNGCPREIFLIISGVLEKAKEHSMGWLPWDEYQVGLLLAKHKLYSWDPKGRRYPTSDPRWIYVAEAFQHACLLRLLRLIDHAKPAQSADIQECVAKVLDSTAKIPRDSSLLELLVLPFFMAGTDCLPAHSQYYVLSRFAEIERRSEFCNPVPAHVLRRVWDARASQDGNDNANIDWTTFTHWPGLTRQHDYLII